MENNTSDVVSILSDIYDSTSIRHGDTLSWGELINTWNVPSWILTDTDLLKAIIIELHSLGADVEVSGHGVTFGKITVTEV